MGGISSVPALRNLSSSEAARGQRTGLLTADTDMRIRIMTALGGRSRSTAVGAPPRFPSFVSPSHLNCLFSPLVFLLVLIFKFYFKLFKTFRMVQKANTT